MCGLIGLGYVVDTNVADGFFFAIFRYSNRQARYLFIYFLRLAARKKKPRTDSKLKRCRDFISNFFFFYWKLDNLGFDRKTALNTHAMFTKCLLP